MADPQEIMAQLAKMQVLAEEDDVQVPAYLKVLWTLVTRTARLAQEEEVGTIQNEVVQLKENLTTVQISFTSKDDEEVVTYHLFAVRLKDGPRFVPLVKIQETDSRKYVVMSQDPKALLAYISF